MKKRILAMALLVVMLLCTGCQLPKLESVLPDKTVEQTAPIAAPTQAPSTPAPTETPVEATPAPDPEPTPTPAPTPEPEPNTVPGKLVYERTGAYIKKLNRGDKVEILEDQGEYCLVRSGNDEGLVKKSLLRDEKSGAYSQWSGYTTFTTVLFGNYHLGNGETPNINTNVTVLDEYDGCYVLSVGSRTMYAWKDTINGFTVHYYNPASDNGGGSGGGGSGGGSGGGGGGSSDEGNDGGDISLAKAFEENGSFVKLAVSDKTAVGTATVKVDNAELYLCFFNPGDQLKVVDYNDKEVTVWYDGTRAKLPRCLVKLDSDKAYTPWTGYAARFAPAYTTHYLSDKEPMALGTNTAQNILDDLGDCYVISINGHYWFVPHSQINLSPVNYVALWGGGGETGGGESGGGGGGGSTPSSGGQEWTDPVM